MTNMEDQRSKAIKKLEEYYAAMEDRDEAEKVMQGHAMRAKQHAHVLVTARYGKWQSDYDDYYYDDKSVQPLIESDFDEIVWQLKNGKWPRRPRRNKP